MSQDMFIKFDGIEGQSVDKNHKNWIDVIDYKMGCLQTIEKGTASDVSGRALFEPFAFTHFVDKSTPKFLQACMNGQKITKAEFSVCQAVAGKQEEIIAIILENIKIKSAEVIANDDNPVEQVELVFAKATWKAKAVNDNAMGETVETSFNVRTK